MFWRISRGRDLLEMQTRRTERSGVHLFLGALVAHFAVARRPRFMVEIQGGEHLEFPVHRLQMTWGYPRRTVRERDQLPAI